MHITKEVPVVGAQLVNVALARWAPYLTDRAFRVLCRMASVALDVPREGRDAATYFGGDELLALTFRGENTKSAIRSARRGVSDLLEIGAIEQIQRSFGGSRAVYRLTLDNDPKPVGNPVDNSPPGSGQHDSGVTLSMTVEAPEHDSGVTPTTKNYLFKEGSTYVDHPRTDRAHDDADGKPNLSIVRMTSPMCAQCGTYLESDGSCFKCNSGKASA